MGGFTCVLLALVACAPAGRPLIAEAFYDAVGDDEGLEFVELLNPTASPQSLAGARLEVGDGAGPGRWTARWTAPPGTTLAPGARFVIGGARVVPPPDAVVELALQNGPDAVRLVWPDGVIETVGYGALGYAEYACGRPAADVASGQSLARIPDDSNQGENALDFRARAPTPGRANQPRRHVAWLAGSVAIEPQIANPGAALRIKGRPVSVGADTLEPGALVARARLVGEGGVEERGRLAWPHAVLPGETLAVSVPATAPLVDGVCVWLAELDVAGDDGEPARDSLRARVGPGALELSEIQFHPNHDEGEWVELRNRSPAAVALSGWVVRDRSGTRGVPQGDPTCPADSLVVLAQDRAALVAAYPGLDAARVVETKPWPALNNTNDDSGVADALELLDPDGLPSDQVAYSAAGVPAGVPLERGHDGRWRTAIDPAGTPLAPARELPALGGTFAVVGPRIAAGTHAVRIAWSLPWESARIRIDAYDLAGARIAGLMADTDVPGRGESEVAVDPLGPGLAVLVLRARALSGAGALEATRVVRVEAAR